jgi:hypothetical protein
MRCELDDSSLTSAVMHRGGALSLLFAPGMATCRYRSLAGTVVRSRAYPAGGRAWQHGNTTGAGNLASKQGLEGGGWNAREICEFAECGR